MNDIPTVILALFATAAIALVVYTLILIPAARKARELEEWLEYKRAIAKIASSANAAAVAMDDVQKAMARLHLAVKNFPRG